MISSSTITGVILLAIGAVLAFKARKRRFDRINTFGVEYFSSYLQKLRARTFDGVISFAAILLLSGGLLVLAFEFESSWGWLVLLPVYAYMLFILIGL
ncbi:MAG TPA: hypothetical protein PLD41_16015 [Casimicrobium huifangae]|jgi:hypothetical protein|nr:hypothetical protein [Casimicrobium huifangae]